MLTIPVKGPNLLTLLTNNESLVITLWENLPEGKKHTLQPNVLSFFPSKNKSSSISIDGKARVQVSRVTNRDIRLGEEGWERRRGISLIGDVETPTLREKKKS